MPARHAPNLIIDVGMFDGTDSAYYLFKGYKVIAIEADPALCERARQRFHAELAGGRLNILNLSISGQHGHLAFYRNLKNPEQSGFTVPQDDSPSECEVLEVPCVTMADILNQCNFPYYLKIDIEGSDELALDTIEEPFAPRYISTELNFATASLEPLKAMGYSSFKLINQLFHTQDFDMQWASDRDVVYRICRKFGRAFPPFRSWMMALPEPMGRRSEWTRPHRPDRWKPPTDSWSGPFAEETH